MSSPSVDEAMDFVSEDGSMTPEYQAMETDSSAFDQSPSPTNGIQPSTPTPSINNKNDPPVKVRKKPGRKPNPASPALRKAQNRAAQRAFRERKERHMRELETAIKQVREQKDKLAMENDQLKADSEILRSENWYLKGIVLTLQLVCFQHNLVIPQHGPYINEQALGVLAQSIPEPISAYISLNANHKLPVPSKLFGYRHGMNHQRDRYLSSGNIMINPHGVENVPDQCNPNLSSTSPAHSNSPTATVSPPNLHSSPTNDEAIGLHSPDLPSLESRQEQPIPLLHPSSLTVPHPPPSVTSQTLNSAQTTSSQAPSSSIHQWAYPSNTQAAHDQGQTGDEYANLPPLSPVHEHAAESTAEPPRPVMLTSQPLTSNLAAIQALRLRLRLQSACLRTQSVPFAIQPTTLQLTIPHDPRIDLIPAPHMRDRMILFRDLFDLDDCFRCLLGNSVFHGGDPAIAANWQLPLEFFEKFWFLTIDYDLRRTTNKWRRLQGLNDIDPFKQQKQMDSQPAQNTDSQQHPSASPSNEPERRNSLYSSPPPLQELLQHPLHQHRGSTDIDFQPDMLALSSFLGLDLMPHNGSSTQTQPHAPQQQPFDGALSESQQHEQQKKNAASYASSFSSESSLSSTSSSTHELPESFTPVHLTDGSRLAHPKKNPKEPVHSFSETCHPWDTLLMDTQPSDYDFMMDSLINIDP
ncbi:uncharacterized protein BYT42DRAFT_576740 [Radiomyces spectabilis]|uniref:uncharacterized protein n=1 Tax=Radiomyces spectabilis TaxID=64574 RepID=UPI00221FAC9F|nr:uncharacterized protein BYT42DRAFT_576740 [Radiomyces spectabilis]KAI8374559.1 hypothetical protein BYT42DRAFT_576740 [Radiomyces spectabilis]